MTPEPRHDHLPARTRQPRVGREYLALFLTGLGMGTADSMPGVSGGTVAFVRGIYADLLNAISSINGDLLWLLLRRDIRGALNHVPWRFLVTLLLGVIIAGFTLARVITLLLQYQPVYLFAFFFGLVLASAVAVSAKLRTWSPRFLAWLAVGAVFGFTVIGLVPAQRSHDPLTLFFSGFLAITAMILPGISGSSIMLILGQYEYILTAVKNLDLAPLLTVGAGSAVGMALFSRLLIWLLNRYNQIAIAVLIGFVVGSLRAVWPWQVESIVVIEGYEEKIRSAIMPDVATPEFVLSLVLCLMGFLLVSFIDHLEARQNPFFRLFWRARPPASSLSQAAE